MAIEITEIPGLRVHLDQLVYHYSPECFSEEAPHAFKYYLTIENSTSHTIKLLGRKWILDYENGSTRVIEGEGIVGETPTLAPGKSFSYQSVHATDQDALATGSFFGLNYDGRAILTRVPPMHLILPPF